MAQINLSPWRDILSVKIDYPIWHGISRFISSGINKFITVSNGNKSTPQVGGPGTVIQKQLYACGGHAIGCVQSSKIVDGKTVLTQKMVTFNEIGTVSGEVEDVNPSEIIQAGEDEFFAKIDGFYFKYQVGELGQLSKKTKVLHPEHEIGGVDTTVPLRNGVATQAKGLLCVQHQRTVYVESPTPPDYSKPWGWIQKLVDELYGTGAPQSFINYHMFTLVSSGGNILSSNIISGLPHTTDGQLVRSGKGLDLAYFWFVEGKIYKITEKLEFELLEPAGHQDITNYGRFLGDFEFKSIDPVTGFLLSKARYIVFSGVGDSESTDPENPAPILDASSVIVLNGKTMDVEAILPYEQIKTLKFQPVDPVRNTGDSLGITGDRITGIFKKTGQTIKPGDTIYVHSNQFSAGVIQADAYGFCAEQKVISPSSGGFNPLPDNATVFDPLSGPGSIDANKELPITIPPTVIVERKVIKLPKFGQKFGTNEVIFSYGTDLVQVNLVCSAPCAVVSIKDELKVGDIVEIGDIVLNVNIFADADDVKDNQVLYYSVPAQPTLSVPNDGFGDVVIKEILQEGDTFSKDQVIFRAERVPQNILTDIEIKAASEGIVAHNYGNIVNDTRSEGHDILEFVYTGDIVTDDELSSTGFNSVVGTISGSDVAIKGFGSYVVGSLIGQLFGETASYRLKLITKKGDDLKVTTSFKLEDATMQRGLGSATSFVTRTQGEYPWNIGENNGRDG